VPADIKTVIEGTNTVEGTQTTNTASDSISTVITDPTPANRNSGDETATPGQLDVTYADQTWTAGASGTINFREDTITPLAQATGGIVINALVGGAIPVEFDCSPGTVTPPDPGTVAFIDPADPFASTNIVTPVDNPPTANAGGDQSVNEGALVTLDGTTSSDPDGEALTYQWSQTSGPAVSLSDPTAAMPTFTAPDVAAPTDLTFDLVVCDEANPTSLCSAADSVTVTVNPVVVPPSNITINDIAVTEGNSGTTAATFTVSLSAAQADPVTVDFATADGTAVAPEDYTAATGTVTFAPGVVAQPVTVLVNGDTTFEPNETFLVNLSNATGNATITDAQGAGTIVNDDAAPPVIDAALDVIVNGPVSHTKTSKSFVLKVTNLGNQAQTITASDISTDVTVGGVSTGTVSVAGLPVTLNPGASKRLKAVWTYGSALVGGETVEFNACVNLTGDIDTNNDCDTATVTAK
jgi:hypothetical protein